MGFGSQVEGQVDQRIDHVASCWQVGRSSKNLKKTICFSRFFGPSALQLRSKIDKKASPDRVKIKEKCCQHLDANFDRFGSQLGSILGGFWRPSWTQVGTKWQQNPTPQPIKNMIIFWKASGTIFNKFLVPTRRARMGLGRHLGPRPP